MAIPQGGAYDITVYQRASFSQVFSLRGADKVTPIDLTGYTARAQARTAAGGDTLVTFVCTHNNTGGDITVTATPTATATMDRPGVWALEIDNTTNIYVLLEGNALVHREVTTP